jgi:hypothetical protein
MRWLAIGAVLTLMGCSSAGSDAEKRYAIVSHGDDPQATCDAAHQVMAGYLKDQNEPKYKEWSATAELDCASARLRALG